MRVQRRKREDQNHPPRDHATLSLARTGGSVSSGIGLARNSRRHRAAMILAMNAERFTRALSVAIPVFAYICLYSFEINTNATRAFRELTSRDRCHTLRQL
jgi:hypothetical protein